MIFQASIFLVCVSSVWTKGSISVDLNSGRTAGSIPNSTWIVSPTRSLSRGACDGQAVLMLQVPTGKAVEIVMTMSHSDGYSFNIGDSPTNNAWGGDSSSTYFDAEVHSRFNRLLIYGRDNPAGGPSLCPPIEEHNFVHPTSAQYSTFKLVVSHEKVVADNGVSVNPFTVEDTCLFQFEGQDGNDLYIGLNRVIHPTSNRIGSGVCKAKITIVDP